MFVLQNKKLPHDMNCTKKKHTVHLDNCYHSFIFRLCSVVVERREGNTSHHHPCSKGNVHSLQSKMSLLDQQRLLPRTSPLPSTNRSSPSTRTSRIYSTPRRQLALLLPLSWNTSPLCFQITKEKRRRSHVRTRQISNTIVVLLV